jgi:Pyruvate/2-oxoacid:ferredoxin oxidoreductase delta subunit
MADVFERLARRLDDMPTGYPATESGVELKILRKIFSPEEAEMALRMRPVPETVEQVAERLGRPVEEMQAILDNMARKGQIGSFKVFGLQMYALFPFLPGIYEFQSERMDKELAEMCEEYYPTVIRAVGEHAPALGRTIPVSTEIKADLKVFRYEDIRGMLEEAKSFQLTECICRNEMALTGSPCKYPLETCLMFSTEEGAFDRYPRGRLVSKQEALQAMADAEEAGLVHVTYNAENEPIMFFCNCCPCCCVVLRALKQFKTPYIIARSNFVAVVEEERCTGCGVCAEERCPMEAIVEKNGAYRVLSERCIGCGVCAPSCPTGAIALVRRPESEQDMPPGSMMEVFMRKAVARGIDLKLDS